VRLINIGHFAPASPRLVSKSWEKEGKESVEIQQWQGKLKPEASDDDLSDACWQGASDFGQVR